MAFDTTKPDTNDAANTIGITTPANFAAISTWADGITPGIAAGAPTVLHCGGSARTQQKQSMARAYETASAALADATWTAVALSLEDFDTDGLHSTASNTSRMTAPVAGKYAFNGYVLFPGSIDGHVTRKLAVTKNGASPSNAGNIYGYAEVPNVGTTSVVLTVSGLVSLAATDYIQMMAYQDSTGARTTTDASFAVHYVGE